MASDAPPVSECGVLYRLDQQMRVTAFIELEMRRGGGGGDRNAATDPVALNESFLSRVGCIQPGNLVRSASARRPSKKNFNNLSKRRKKMKESPQASTRCNTAQRRACSTSTGGASPPPRSRRGRARIFLRAVSF